MTTEKTLLRCNQCGKEFKYDSERKRHEQSHVPQFACKVCSKTFSFISALRRHEKQHERTGKVKCDLCDKAFKDNLLLKRHIKYAHDGIQTCTKCDGVFNSEPALRTHMQTHKAESERRYHCSFEGCNKKFNFAHHLKHHELTHTNTKEYFCKICNKGFIQSHHLKTHLKTHSADYSLQCTFLDCNKKFATEYAKKRHVARHHTKTDSGISSDSNSTGDCALATLKVTDIKEDRQLQHSQLEALIRSTDYYDKECAEEYNSEKHNVTTTSLAENISKTIEEDNTTMLIDYRKFIKDIPEDLSLKTINNSENLEKYNINDVSDCKSAVGGCIMNGESENCVCAQITDTIDDNYDFTPIGTALKLTNVTQSSKNCEMAQCCGGRCSATNPSPEIEFREDGIVKIKEFMDTAIDLGVKSRNVNFVPYNSCKAILGNCIVSGNGTIGDGCLCAKMVMDEQVTAEEIDDITPRPNIVS